MFKKLLDSVQTVSSGHQCKCALKERIYFNIPVMYYNLSAIIPVIYRFSVRISFHSQQHLEPFTLRRVHSDSKIFAFGLNHILWIGQDFGRRGRGCKVYFFSLVSQKL